MVDHAVKQSSGLQYNTEGFMLLCLHRSKEEGGGCKRYSVLNINLTGTWYSSLALKLSLGYKVGQSCSSKF